MRQRAIPSSTPRHVRDFWAEMSTSGYAHNVAQGPYVNGQKQWIGLYQRHHGQIVCIASIRREPHPTCPDGLTTTIELTDPITGATETITLESIR